MPLRKYESERERRREEARRYRARHRAKYNERATTWRKANADTVAAYQRQWRAENQDRRHAWNIANKARQNELRRARYRANPNADIARAAQRRARIARANGSASAAQIQARIAYFGGVCAYCGGPFEHIEHAIPLARGGSNWPANIRPSCASCNLSKGTRTPFEFRVTP